MITADQKIMNKVHNYRKSKTQNFIYIECGDFSKDKKEKIEHYVDKVDKTA